MDFDYSWLLIIAASYMTLLFFIAWVTDRGWLPSRLVRHPAVYVLSLGVYASAWATYGSVGYAYYHGYNFLPYFLGLSGAFLLAPILLAPILRLTKSYQLSSLADLFAFRYRSRIAGTLTTVAMLAGMLPLLSLQIEAVVQSIHILSGAQAPPQLAIWFCLILTLFAILFGARHATPREKHEGLVVAVAAESLIKLTAFVSVALLGLFGVFDGPSGLMDWLDATPDALTRLYAPLQDGTWHSLILAFFVSALVVPHMFHMTFTENMNPRALVTASWGLPLFMFIIALCIPIILWSAIAGGATPSPDYFTLSVGTMHGNPGVMLAYIAGLTGASGMLIVATLALSSMTMNHLVLPLQRPLDDERFYGHLLWGRRFLIATIVSMAYLFWRVTSGQYGLTQLGVVSFVATLQFVPGIIGVLFWPAANRYGFISGLLAGFGLWLLVLLLPMLGQVAAAEQIFQWLGFDTRVSANPWHQIAIVSVSLNATVFVLVSLVIRTDAAEVNAAQACAVDSLRRPFRWELEAASVDDFIRALSEPLGPVTAEREVSLALRDLGLPRIETRPYAMRRLRDQLETNLSGLLGPTVAYQIVDRHLPYKPHSGVPTSEDIRFIESRLEQYRHKLSGLAAELDSLRRFHRQTLLELPVGVVSLGADGEIIGWNLAMERMTGVTASDVIGARLGTLPSPWREMLEDFVSGKNPHEPQQEARINTHPHWFNLHKSEVMGDLPGEQSGGVVLVVEDITELRTLESQLAHNERLASIGRLAAGVAHEIGNPVTAIACLAQNIDRDTAAEELEKSMLQVITQTRRISRILESLVAFSHRGVLVPSPEPVSTADTVAEAISLIGLDPERRQQIFVSECAPDHRVTGDSQRLLQVFINLLGNAADASDDGNAVIINSRRADNSIEITIEDRGHGVPPELAPSLFEPFVTSKPPGRGTGLGLAMVYSIIKEHGGSIQVHSPVIHDRGTRFTILLPAWHPDNTDPGEAA